MNRVNFLVSLSTDSVVVHEERSSGERTPPKHETPNVPNSTELSGVRVRDVITILPVTSPEPIMSVQFLSKTGKDATYEGGDGWKGYLFPARVGIPTLMYQ